MECGGRGRGEGHLTVCELLSADCGGLYLSAIKIPRRRPKPKYCGHFNSSCCHNSFLLVYNISVTLPLALN